jgi:hypothetical protein
MKDEKSYVLGYGSWSLSLVKQETQSPKHKATSIKYKLILPPSVFILALFCVSCAVANIRLPLNLWNIPENRRHTRCEHQFAHLQPDQCR